MAGFGRLLTASLAQVKSASVVTCGLEIEEMVR